MAATQTSVSSQRSALIIRDPGERLLAGVAAATGKRLGVDAMFVRVAFVVLSLAGGAGLLLYVVVWSLTPEQQGGDPRTPPVANLHRAAALAIQVLGAMLVLRSVGLWAGDALVWPLSLAALGSCVLWARSDDERRGPWATVLTSNRPVEGLLSQDVSLPRRLIGGGLAVSGLFALLVTNVRLNDLGGAVVAFVLAITGLALLLGPALFGLLHQVGEERRERIRSEERAEIGAHLHDSVLHTLALIQRSSSPQEMATLARSQERELRSWLQGRTAGGEAATVSHALDAVAARIEANQHAAVDVVVVGDAPLDAELNALVAAVGEAATNAAKHSGSPDVSIYVELEPAAVTAYVRDEGSGFDPDAVAPDRHGIAQSIRGRIERHGGTVTIDSRPGEGTEVAMTLPRRTP